MGEDKSTSVTLGALCTQDLEDVSKFAMFQTQVCFEEQLECELYQVI